MGDAPYWPSARRRLMELRDFADTDILNRLTEVLRWVQGNKVPYRSMKISVEGTKLQIEFEVPYDYLYSTACALGGQVRVQSCGSQDRFVLSVGPVWHKLVAFRDRPESRVDAKNLPAPHEVGPSDGH